MAPFPPPLPPRFSSHPLARAAILPEELQYPLDFTPAVLGNWSSHFLSGIILVQAFSYHQRHRRDSMWIKAPLYGVFAANVILEALTLSRELKVYGKHYGDFDFTWNFHNRVEDIWIGFLSVTITVSVQIFLLVRTWVFARALLGRLSTLRWAWTTAKFACILLSFASGLAMQANFIKFEDYAAYSQVNRFQYLCTEAYPLLELIWLVSGISADVFICGSMSWGLHKAKTGNKHSNGFLQIVINNSLRNGAVLVCAQILCFAFYFATSAFWTDMALSLIPRLATISLLSSIASPREAARIQAKRAASTSTPAWEEKNYHPRPAVTSTDFAPAPADDDPREPTGKVSFGTPCILKAKLDALTKKQDRRKQSSSSKRRRNPQKRNSSYSLSGGISVEMTSRVDVEDVWVDEKDGNNKREKLRFGNSVRIEGPTSSSGSKDDQPPDSRRGSGTPSFTLGLPFGHVQSVQTGIYDPDMDEYDLPTIILETEEWGSSASASGARKEKADGLRGS